MEFWDFYGYRRPMTPTTLAYAAIAGLLCTANAVAHAPYERTVCSFVRQDGVSISAVEHYVDGIFGRDPVAVQFRLADGSVIASTVRTRDTLVVRRGPTGVDIYRFPSDWIPVAGSLQRFDGYSLTDIRTRGKQWSSLFIHTLAEWRSYAVPLVLGALIAAAWIAVSRIPKDGGLRMLRVSGFACIGFAAAILTLLTFCASSASPLVFSILAVFCFAVGFTIRKFVRRFARAGGHTWN